MALMVRLGVGHLFQDTYFLLQLDCKSQANMITYHAIFFLNLRVTDIFHQFQVK